MQDAPDPSGQEAAALTVARRLGRQQADAFDHQLREAESREREKRLAETAWRPRVDRGAWAEEADSLRVVRLEARISELSTYLRAVNGSLPWRVIQGVRRFFGRAW